MFIAPQQVKASRIILHSDSDAFVRKNYPNKNYGSWNDMTIGESWNLGNYFSDSYGYIHFPLPNFTKQHIIKSATLELYQYARSDYAKGSYTVSVAKENVSWSELGITWNNQPSFSKTFDTKRVGGSPGSWFKPPQKYSWNVTDIVKNGSYYGFVFYKASGNAGGFWCSRNYNNKSCFSNTQPKLTIKYIKNSPPNTPQVVSPKQSQKFGGDSSANGVDMQFSVSNVGDKNGNLSKTWFYLRGKGQANWNVFAKKSGTGTVSVVKQVQDGTWEWKVRSKDSLSLWSMYSSKQEFLVDTTPPSDPELVGEPDTTSGTKNIVYAKKSKDTLSNNIFYKFQAFKGIKCNKIISQSKWTTELMYAFKNLVKNKLYCYQVKVKDELGNESGWSKFERSWQDPTGPIFTAISLSTTTISPNGDGENDSITLSFTVKDVHLSSWSVHVKSPNSKKIIKSYKGKNAENKITWNGVGSSGKAALEGTYHFSLFAEDTAGNARTVKTALFSVDLTPPHTPTCTFKDTVHKYKKAQYTNKIHLNIQCTSEVKNSISVAINRDGQTVSNAQSPSSSLASHVLAVPLGTVKGSSEDGKYSLQASSIDSAGNVSSSYILNIIRDTVAPEKPKIKKLYWCGKKICMNVTGEKDTKLVVNGKTKGRISKTNQKFIVHNSRKPNKAYSFRVYLIDVSHNTSMTVKKKLKPVVLGKGAVKDDQSKGNRNFSSIYFKTIIEPDGTYRITDLSIPAPQLVSAVTDLNGKITIKGHAIPAGHPIITDIEKQYMSFNEAKIACGRSVLPFGKKWECMKKKTGVESIWKDAIRKVASCGLKLSCMGNIDNLRHVEYFSQETYKLQHSMVGLYKDVQNSSYISHLWNGSPDGSFQFNVTLDQEVHAGEDVKAAAVIFGSFKFNGMTIDYRGLNTEDAKLNHGLGSGFSNNLKINAIPDFQNVVISPVTLCENVRISSYYGYRTDPFSYEKKLHNGIDLANPGEGCKIVSAYSGNASTGWWAGYTVTIIHNDRFTTKYGHAAYYIGSYSRAVSKSEDIMFMGQSGKATGIHLHFSVFDGGIDVDPYPLFKKYFEKLPY